MRFDIHLRAGVKDQIEELVGRMRDWEEAPRVDQEENSRIASLINPFPHSTSAENLVVAGIDGTGDFPALAYGDSFVYVTLAQATVYRSEAICGLKEEFPLPEPLLKFTWLPGNPEESAKALDESFSSLSGRSLHDVIAQSDYREIKAVQSGKSASVEMLANYLIRPPAWDGGNLGIQLRSSAELGAALRIIGASAGPSYLLIDGTMSLPFVGRKDHSLFYEHLKRLCCKEARERRVGFFSLSKSHGLPGIDLIESIARTKLDLTPGVIPEHWFFRIPSQDLDNWKFSLVEGRNIPPPSAVTYLLRFHKSTPLMRLDMDRDYWVEQVRGSSNAETLRNEQKIFSDLDYTCHDQRCFGYPYPIKAAHDRASLTEMERVSLRKKIMDAAVGAGMKRSLFRDASQATGHG